MQPPAAVQRRRFTAGTPRLPPAAGRTEILEAIPVGAEIGDIQTVAEMMDLRDLMDQQDSVNVAQLNDQFVLTPEQPSVPASAENPHVISEGEPACRGSRRKRLPASLASDYVMLPPSRRIRLEAAVSS